MALARAAMRDPKILIIDDITSNHVMDTQNNRILIETLREVMAGRTNIILSQKLPIIQHANIIHVLQVINIKIAPIIRTYCDCLWHNKLPKSLNMSTGNVSNHLLN